MHIEELKINNFRCYKEAFACFSPGINIIIGENATGKTSLVEAVFFACAAKSNRTSIDKEAIMFDNEAFFIETKIKKQNRLEKIKLSVDQSSKKITINGKTINQLSDFVGRYSVVFFGPDDLEIIKGGPFERRKFLDISISQNDSDYLKALIRYKKLLKARNDLLKQENKDLDLLKIYESEIIESGKTIITKRESFIKTINPYFQNKENVISGKLDVGKVVYKPSTNVENYEDNFKKSFRKDEITQNTNIGPHRDDFCVLINGSDCSFYGSQGQKKTVCIALKFALGEYLISKGKEIIIILDDVFSELDEIRQNQMMSLLEKGNQIFITTTSINLIDKEILGKSKIIKVEKGGVLNG